MNTSLSVIHFNPAALPVIKTRRVYTARAFESFMGTLKREMLQGGCFEDATDARLELFEYIDGYYNNQRKHSAIGYLPPKPVRSSAHQPQLINRL